MQTKTYKKQTQLLEDIYAKGSQIPFTSIFFVAHFPDQSLGLVGLRTRFKIAKQLPTQIILKIAAI
jgi:hypothetical protein